MTAPIVSVADQLAQRAREVLPIAPDADVIVGVVNGRIIRVEVDGIDLPAEVWQPHQARFADLMGGACDGGHDDLCVPLEGGKPGESRCTGCGMVFLRCPGCSQTSPATIYHAEPLCSRTMTDEEFEVWFQEQVR